MNIENSVDWDIDSSVRNKVSRVNNVREDIDVGAKVGCCDSEVIE